MMAAGPSGFDKDRLTTKLLVDNLDLFEIPPKRIYYCYGSWQDGFKCMNEHGLKFQGGFPTPNSYPSAEGGLLVLDDLMEEGGNDKRISDLFAKDSHHSNITVIYLSQDMFPPVNLPGASRETHIILWDSSVGSEGHSMNELL